jgi:hypothetical protein
MPDDSQDRVVPLFPCWCLKAGHALARLLFAEFRAPRVIQSGQIPATHRSIDGNCTGVGQRGLQIITIFDRSELVDSELLVTI